MRRILVALLVASIAGPGVEARALMQMPTSKSTIDDASWQRLQVVKRGSRVLITTVSGAEIEGKLSEITSTALTMKQARVRKGSLATVNDTGTVDMTLMFARADILFARAEGSKHLGLWIGIAAAAVGLLFLVSPAGQCIQAGSSCS